MALPNKMAKWPEFMEAVLLRMEKGREAYGDASFSRPPAELAGEVEEELLDIVGWSYILWYRLRGLKASIPVHQHNSMRTDMDTEQDVVVSTEGGLTRLTPVTSEASEWLEANCQWQEWQKAGGSYISDGRMARAIVTGLEKAGFRVRQQDSIPVHQ